MKNNEVTTLDCEMKLILNLHSQGLTPFFHAAWTALGLIAAGVIVYLIYKI